MCLSLKEVLILGKKLKQLTPIELLELRKDPKLVPEEYNAIRDEILRRLL